MIFCDEEYPRILDEIADFLTPAEVELSFVEDEAMRELNAKSRKIDKATDVLSFPFEYVPHAPLGCVVINIECAARVANELGHEFEEELALLFTHGLLHILGFDHETDEGQMRNYEEEVMKKFNLPPSLIVRTQQN